ncbi:MAG: phage tail sheath C-terminal domain-containing protein [Methylotetracoccus sp.]
MAYKTPGVYIEEIATFPPSVVAVETAIPAFIGYTETAVDTDGGDLTFTPTRITSLLEFQRRFGGDFVPASYQVVVDRAAGNAVGTVSPRNAGGTERRYHLSASLRHFYANGGGPCYIVSVGSHSDAPAAGDITTPAGLLGGLSRLEPFDEPTLLLFPDGVSLNADDLGAVQQAALSQCEKLQDRFVIMDLRQGDLPASPTVDPIAVFRQNVGINNLKYGAAYYPWVHTIYRPEVRFRQLTLVNPDQTSITPAQVNTLTADVTVNALVPAVRDADTVVATIVSAVNISGMAGPNPLILTRSNFARLPDHYASLLDLLRQTPANATIATIRQRFGNLVLLPRAIALALRTLEAATLPATLSLAINQLSQDQELRDTISDLIAYEKNPGVLGSVSATRDATAVVGDYTSLAGSAWILPNADVGAAIPPSGEVFTGANARLTALNAAAALSRYFDKLAAAILSLFSAAEFLAGEAERQLFEKHPVFRDVAEQVSRTMTLFPASGAVAGVYAAVDRTRGVWKAPANLSLADVSGPAVKINDQGQDDLNVTTTGKSVNALRAFAGKGTLVWGARTLAGNDNEWRYVPVRRFFNMAEESIKKATEPFVFEPNDRSTWVRVRAMIENFLTVLWRQGALAGAVPQQAFFVKVGLGETMTAQDILEGRMIVEIGMAVVRPAEFIILRFAHKMQAS